MAPTSAERASSVEILPLPPLQPDLHERAWQSTPHPTLPLIATAHAKAVTVFSLSTLSSHSTLTGGHARSVRSAAWKPGLSPHKLCLVTGSFDATAGLWRWDGSGDAEGEGEGGKGLETEVKADGRGDGDDDADDWEFTLVLEGHDSEIKSVAFSPSGAHLATCSRDKSVWIWEDIGATEADDEWETIAVLNEHDGDVKAVAWCPDVPGRNARRRFGADVLASASYDDTVRIWREDGDGEWVCVAVLEGHGGTVWGLQWEPRPRDDTAFPRLMTCSADGSIRVWSLKEDEEDDDDAAQGGAARSALGGIPNTMRRSLREEWTCTSTLPVAHNRDVYSIAWSAQSGIVASTGSDGVVALYKEDGDKTTAPAAGEDHPMTNNGDAEPQAPGASSSSAGWRLLTTLQNAHGPYEVNHITWCRRYDAACERKGEEEMLVTTGDDGVVRPWAVSFTP